MNAIYRLTPIVIIGAMLVTVISQLWHYIEEPYVGLFLGQFIFFAAGSTIILHRIIKRTLVFTRKLHASATVIFVFICQIALAWLAFGLFFFATKKFGYSDQTGLVIDASLRNSLVVQQALALVLAVATRWSTTKLDRTIAILLTLFALILVLPNYRW